MAYQHVFTSSPQGLKPGTRGFTTVAASRELSPTLVSRLELLSGYTLAFNSSDPRSKLNPINYSHVKLTVGGEKYTVVSRIAPTGSDYTGRSNSIAHHLIVGKKEEPAAGPGWLAMQSDLFLKEWTGQPRVLPAMTLAPGHCQANPCATWGKLLGDPGYAGLLVGPIISQPGRPIVLVCSPEQAPDVPALLAEALAILPASLRWDVTFSTYFTATAPDVHCRVRFILSTDPLAEQARRVASIVFLDLTHKPSGRPLPGEPFESCRKGSTWPDIAAPTPIPTLEETSDRVHPAAAKMLRIPQSEPALQDQIIAEIAGGDDPSGAHNPTAPISAVIIPDRRARRDESDVNRNLILGGIALAVVTLLILIGAYYAFMPPAPPSTLSTGTNEGDDFPLTPARIEPSTTAQQPHTVTAAGTAKTGSALPKETGATSQTTPASEAGLVSINQRGAPGSTAITIDTPPPAMASSSASTTAATTTAATEKAAGFNAGVPSESKPLPLRDIAIYDPGNSRTSDSTARAGKLLQSQRQLLTAHNGILKARFKAPFPETVGKAINDPLPEIELVLALPRADRQLQARIKSGSDAIAQVKRRPEDLDSGDPRTLYEIWLERANEGSWVELNVRLIDASLAQFNGACVLVQTPGNPLLPSQVLFSGYYAEQSAATLVVELPLATSATEQKNPTVTSAQFASALPLNWTLYQQVKAPTKWSDGILIAQSTPSRQDLAQGAEFHPIIMGPSSESPSAYIDILVESQGLTSLWQMHRDLAQRKAKVTELSAILKENIEAYNTLVSSRGYRPLRRVPGKDSLREIKSELDVRTKSSDPMPEIHVQANELLKDALAAVNRIDTEQKLADTAEVRLKELSLRLSRAVYLGQDHFGNTIGAVTFQPAAVVPVGAPSTATASEHTMPAINMSVTPNGSQNISSPATELSAPVAAPAAAPGQPQSAPDDSTGNTTLPASVRPNN